MKSENRTFGEINAELCSLLELVKQIQEEVHLAPGAREENRVIGVVDDRRYAQDGIRVRINARPCERFERQDEERRREWTSLADTAVKRDSVS
jgi:hypothetical protein